MKVNICVDERLVTYEVPHGVHFVGFSIDYDNERWKQWEFSSDTLERDDVEILDEHGLRVVLHSYSGCALAEAAESLKAFEGMCFLKVSWRGLDVSIVM